MITHSMKLNHEPFNQILKGEKTIEIRLYDEKRKLVQVGDEICFTHSEDKAKTVTVRVVNIHNYPTFSQLFNAFPLSKFGFSGYSHEKAIEKIYTYYTPIMESEFGVVGIEFIVI